MKALAGEPMTFTVNTTVQGRPLRREVTYAVDRDSDGKVRGVYGLGYDVTRREQLTEQLQRVQHDLAAVLNHMPARITAWTADSVNRFANATAEAAFGMDPGQSVGMHVESVLGSARYARARPFIEAALGGQRQTQEYDERLADGSQRYTRVQYIPDMQDGAVNGLYALAVDVTELHNALDRVRQLAQRLEGAREEERRSVAVMLHEGIAQDLLATQLSVRQLESQSRGRAGVTAAFEEIGAGIARCMQDLRAVANELRPTSLAHLRVSQALTEYAKRFGSLANLRIDVKEAEGFPKLSEADRFVFFRAAQEALTNVARHAAAGRGDIEFSSEADRVTMTVTDDGCGFSAGSLSKPGSLGLLSIRERVEALGGRSVLTSGEVNGSVLTVFLPWPEARRPIPA